ncbi:MAG: alpha/beta fold hydrolase [Marinicaulis sp.]|nr:alpha/beta fold hydrolase [Marinicaulis sp.]NNE39670.1 alpha/beta fold hydrolase [Marinicaulis sp.]NNL90418.1 alpha/beta fold hydrolase [Marinicaulis sp.]
MSSGFYGDVKKPSKALLAIETGRALAEFAALPAARPFLNAARLGDGHPVLVCPGFLGGDGSTTVLRNFIHEKGYDVYGWKLGQNLGLKTTGDEGELLIDRVTDIFARRKRRLTLVGWSLGGVMCREIAKAMPDKIRQVVTLGSPIVGRPDTSNVHWLYERLTGHVLNNKELTALQRELSAPPEEVPSTSIFTKTDGIVAWRTCIEPPSDFTDNIEVYASHCGLGVNAAVFYALADRLCLEPDEWEPFDRMKSVWRQMTYPSAGHVYHSEKPKKRRRKKPAASAIFSAAT